MLSKRIVDRIRLTSELAKTITLYETRYKLDESEFGTKWDQSIFAPASPEFEGGKCYRIQVANDGNTLNATFVILPDAEPAQTEQEAQAARAAMLAARDQAQVLQELETLNPGFIWGVSAEVDDLLPEELGTRFKDTQAELLQRAREQFERMQLAYALLRKAPVEMALKSVAMRD
ncbi:MAG: hypothetical protein HY324_00990 [Chlamydiia bacterium]|nr:hypothetical protein [Chlamydiia bacterium]